MVGSALYSYPVENFVPWMHIGLYQMLFSVFVVKTTFFFHSVNESYHTGLCMCTHTYTVLSKISFNLVVYSFLFN